MATWTALNQQSSPNMSSRSREDSDSALLGGGARQGGGTGRKRQRHAGENSPGKDDGGGENDIESADMEELMDDILSPQPASPSSSPATSERLLGINASPPTLVESGVEDVTRSSAKSYGEQRVSSSLRGSTSGRGGVRAIEERGGEEMGEVVVGKPRRRSSRASGRRGSGKGDDSRRGSGIINRCKRTNQADEQQPWVFGESFANGFIREMFGCARPVFGLSICHVQ